MRRMIAAAAAAAALACSGAAHALDGASFYAGVQIGYSWSDSEVNIPAYSNPADDVDADGVTAGGFAGADWELSGPWSLGVEVEANWSDVEGDALSGGSFSERYSIEENWNASVRARVSRDIMENTAVYAAAGWTWSDVETNYIPPAGGNSSDTLNGWNIALGVEHNYNENVFTRAEVRYTDLDEGDFSHGGPSEADLDSTAVSFSVGWRF